ncbi:MAG TPA: hypothetical protein VJ785_01110 [Anaerolineales bacterium]|nr:hypothetical protein [Anaerolineales bacterium]
MTSAPVQSLVVLDEHDVDRILRILYNGTRPSQLHVLVCGCGTLADLHESPKAWDRWQVLPHALCPECLEKEAATPPEHDYPDEAWARFAQDLHDLFERKDRT